MVSNETINYKSVFIWFIIIKFKKKYIKRIRWIVMILIINDKRIGSYNILMFITEYSNLSWTKKYIIIYKRLRKTKCV